MSGSEQHRREISFVPPEATGLSTGRLEHAYGLLEQSVERGALMGAAIQVSRRGMCLTPRCFGRRVLRPGGERVACDTVFLVASVTKPVMATAAMLLVERGKLSLDTPVSAIIPEFGRKRKHGILIRHLLTHTSGLPDQLPQNQRLRARHAPLSEFIQRICDVGLLFPPGTGVSYQSCGFAMLSAVLEQVEGVSTREFVRRELFVPLGMRDTSLGAPQNGTQRISQVRIPSGPFQYGDQGADWNWNSKYWGEFGAPWGGLFSTAQDLTLFCQMFLQGGRGAEAQILSPVTVARMTTSQIDAMPNIPDQSKLIHRWGLGWRLANPNNSTFGDLVSPATYGHTGATGTLVWVDPERELSCVLLTNDPSGAAILRPLVSNAIAASVID